MHPRNNFDGLRLTGALLVLFSHQFALSGREEPQVVGGASFGALGVLIFFSISGYLVGQSWLNDPNVRRFAFKRFLRIWPGLATMVVITTAVALLVTGTIARPAYLANLLIVYVDGAFFPNNRYHLMNGSLWTIQLEVLCYVCLACIGLVSGRRLPLVLAVLAGVVAPAYMMLMGAVKPGLQMLPYFSAFFFAGAAQARTVLRGRVVAVLCTAGLVALAQQSYGLGLLLIVPAATVFIGRQSWPVLNAAGRFGDMSYGVYLWAWPVQQVGVLLLSRETWLPALLAVSLIVTGALAWLSWHLVERQALRLKPGRSPNHSEVSGLADVSAAEGAAGTR